MLRRTRSPHLFRGLVPSSHHALSNAWTLYILHANTKRDTGIYIFSLSPLSWPWQIGFFFFSFTHLHQILSVFIGKGPNHDILARTGRSKASSHETCSNRAESKRSILCLTNVTLSRDNEPTIDVRRRVSPKGNFPLLFRIVLNCERRRRLLGFPLLKLKTGRVCRKG